MAILLGIKHSLNGLVEFISELANVSRPKATESIAIWPVYSIALVVVQILIFRRLHMPKSIHLILSLLLLSPLKSLSYTGSGSTEAILEFTHFIELPVSEKSGIDESLILKKIEEQVLHMVGPMARVPFRSSPKGDQEINTLPNNREYIKDELGKITKLRVHYNYKGTAVVDKRATSPYTLYLPLDSEDLYFKAGGSSEDNLCTDPHYTAYGDFWYFWSPTRPGCENNLVENVDYHAVLAKITRIPNSSSPKGVKTYPEYKRLADKNGTVKIMLLMGMDDPSNNPNPILSAGAEDDDLNALNFRKIRSKLMGPPSRGGFGFKARRWENSEINAVLEEGTRPLPYVEEFIETYSPTNQRGQRLEVVMFFGKAGIDENSKGFHYFFRKALKEYSVVIYDGHSGLGGHLYLDGIEELRSEQSGKPFRFELPICKYQILYFNSCSSYSYYNASFFPQKKTASDPAGTKSLDIVATGLETAFDGGARTNLELISTVRNWLKYGPSVAKSYLELVKRLENDNLSGVNGDEDNPTSQLEVGNQSANLPGCP
jgi:hypothetical protein